MHTNSLGVTTVNIAEGVVIPEDSFTTDGWPGAIRHVGEGTMFGGGTVIDIDPDT